MNRLPLASLAALALAGGAHGGLVSWIDAFGGTFDDAGNWSPAQVPGAADQAVFDVASVGYNMLLDVNAQCADLEFRNASSTWISIGGTKTFDVGGFFIVSDGLLQLWDLDMTAATTLVASDGDLDVMSGASLTTELLRVSGAAVQPARLDVLSPAQLDVAASGGDPVTIGDSAGHGILTVSGPAAIADVQGRITVSTGGANGELTVQNGATLVCEGLLVNAFGGAGSSGSVLVTGAGTTATATGPFLTWLGLLDGPATLTVADQALVTLQSDLRVDQNGAVGVESGATLSIESGEAFFNNGGALHLDADATLDVADGGLLNFQSGANLDADGALALGTAPSGITLTLGMGSTATAASVTLGDAPGTDAVMNVENVSGQPSTLATSGDVVVGDGGDGVLNVRNGGRAEIGGDLVVAGAGGGDGTLTVTGFGQTGIGSRVLLTGPVSTARVGTTATSNVQLLLDNKGTLSAPGDVLVGAVPGGFASVDIAGPMPELEGALLAGGDLEIGAAGNPNILSATIAMFDHSVIDVEGTILVQSQGWLEMLGAPGTMQLDALGGIVVEGRATLDGPVSASLSNQGQVFLGPERAGTEVTLGGAYGQSDAAEITFEITSDTVHDRLTYSAQANVAGTLRLSWATGYVPTPGTSYELIDDNLGFGNGIIGTFSTVESDLPVVLSYVGFALRAVVPSGVPGDVDQDGTVGVTDLLQLLAAWGTCPGCAADLDGDGLVGVTDLLALLAGWG